LQTAISDLEVEHRHTVGSLYFCKYFMLDDSNSFLEVATTRPETMFSDVALAVHPEDMRYKTFLGKTVINPVNNQNIKIISDERVDMNFATGVMKITPAHDLLDYEIGLIHNLPSPSCISSNGTMNQLAGEFSGMDRFICRTKVVEKHQFRREEYEHNVAFSSRSNTIIEPYLSEQ
jgi:valyl-tRNA synthetase